MSTLSMLPGLSPDSQVDDVAHIIQTALTPVFMLSGIGTLLNLFNTRLARVADHIDAASDQLDTETDPDSHAWLTRHLRLLSWRTVMLDTAILMAGVGGASTCGAALVLFLGSVRDSSVASWLVIMFGAALTCTVGALSAFLGDGIMAWHWLRVRRRKSVTPAADDPASNTADSAPADAGKTATPAAKAS